MVIGPHSADTTGGWQNHYQRMLRWETRSIQALEDLPRTSFHDAIDYSLAYFLWSHSLYEWLHESGAISKAALNRTLESYEIWPLCRDVANRVRHFDLNRSPTDRDWALLREYLPFETQLEDREKHSANLFFNGKKYRVTNAIRASSKMWLDVISSLNTAQSP
jgi:hypothetical protein